MITRTTHSRRAFTLIEALATIVALSIIASALGPIVYAASDAYAGATQHRQSSEAAAHAIDRIVRAIREIPTTEASGTPNITAATPALLTWADTNAIAYDPSLQQITLTLTLTLTDQPRAILADRIEAFSLRYLDHRGLPIDPSLPEPLQSIRRIEISLTIQSTEHRAAATIRNALGAE